MENGEWELETTQEKREGILARYNNQISTVLFSGIEIVCYIIGMHHAIEADRRWNQG